MKPAFTFDEIREAEKNLIEKENIPSLVLMENAGLNSFRVLFEDIEDLHERNIFIICGKGNNAGDGFVLARHLLINVYEVKIILIEQTFKGDALINYQLLEKRENDNLEFI